MNVIIKQNKENQISYFTISTTQLRNITVTTKMLNLIVTKGKTQSKQKSTSETNRNRDKIANKI